MASNLFSPERALGRTSALGELPAGRDMVSRLLKTAVPAVAESVLIALVSLVDTIMVSKLGTFAVAAVGLTTQPRMLAISFFWAVSFATSAVVARRNGEHDKDNANRTLKCSILIVLVLTAIISTTCIVFGDTFIRLMGAKADTQGPATEYFKIIMGGMFFNVMSMVMNGAQRGAGNTRIALRTNITSNVVNVCFNYLLIGGNLGFPALGIRGAAIATVIGTIAAFIMSAVSLLPKDGFVSLRYKLKDKLFNRTTLGAIGKIGSGALVENLSVRVGFLLFAAVVASLGTAPMAIYQIGMNIMTVSFAFGDGLATASVALVGYSLGERRPDMAKIFVIFAQRFALMISLALSTVYFFFGRQIYDLFSDDPYVLDSGRQIMYVMCFIVMLQLSVVIFTTSLRAAGDTRFTSTISWFTLLRPLVCYILCIVFEVGLFGAYMGIAVDQGLRLLLTWTRFAKGKWMLNYRI